MEAFEYLTSYYSNYDEANRLSSKHGQVEFLTTLRYIHKYLKPGMKIIEIGAGPGRYSHYFAQRGYAVDAVELVEHNIELFKAAERPGEKITVTQGNAVDLTGFGDENYDITLLLGPMYHLYTTEDKLRALSEALRVTKPGGILFAAYCIADPAILGYGFQKNNIFSLIEKGLVDTERFRARSTPAEVFELHRREDIEALTAHFNVTRLHYVASDGFTNHMRAAVDAMDDRTFEMYLQYHFTVCERPDMAGLSHHSLDILRKAE